MQVDSDRTWVFDAAPADVWAAVAAVPDYPRWWPWLRDFDGTALATGEVWSCRVQPPLPYALSFRVRLVEVVEADHACAVVEGDLAGEAHLSLGPGPGTGASCTLRLASRLAPRAAVLRAVAQVAPPVARYGHDWVLDTGLRQFRHHLP